MKVIAIDVAILPPEPVNALAMTLNAHLPRERSRGLRLDADHLPHVTLTQQFVPVDALDAVLERIAATVRDNAPLTLHSPGALSSGDSAWLAIEPARPLLALHRRLMDALVEFEQARGGSDAFVDDDARANDVRWVTNYRTAAAFESYRPHITLGHGDAPGIAPVSFRATEIAVCHLGRFCSCRRVLRSWTLSGDNESA